jgi:hypothetical protein
MLPSAPPNNARIRASVPIPHLAAQQMRFYGVHVEKAPQGANERPYLTHTGRVSNAEKQPTGPGPTGCDENGPAAPRCSSVTYRFRYAPSHRQSGSDRLADGPF